MILPWPPWWPRRPVVRWQRTWHAPCEDVTTKGKEFVKFHVPQGTQDRLTSTQPARRGNAMRVEVRHGDQAWDSDAGKAVPGGWRAEAIGPTDLEGDRPVRYVWSTLFDAAYPLDPRVDAPDPQSPDHKDHGKRIWQVFFQWHQGNDDVGVEPPIAFTVVGGHIMLDVHRHDPGNEANSIQVGQWPVAPLDAGRWHDFAVEVRWHPSDGSIKLWHDHAPVTFAPQVPPNDPAEPVYPTKPTQTLTGLGTLFPPKQGTAGPSNCYMKVGLYRRAVPTAPPGPFVLHHDEISRQEQTGLVVLPVWWPRPVIALPPIPLPPIPLPPWPPPPPIRGGPGRRVDR